MMLAYEIDGFGSFLKMDDANVPSLLSLPYIGYITRCGFFLRFLGGSLSMCVHYRDLTVRACMHRSYVTQGRSHLPSHAPLRSVAQQPLLLPGHRR